MSFAYMLVTIYGDDEEEAWANKGKIVDWMLEGEQQGSMPDDYSCESESSLGAMNERIVSMKNKGLVVTGVEFQDWFGEKCDNPKHLTELILQLLNTDYSIDDLREDIKGYYD